MYNNFVGNFVLLIIITLCVSCSGSGSNKKKQVNSIVGSGYYQCNYSKNHYDIILSSGTRDSLYEIWGVEYGGMKKLKQVNIDSIDFNRIIQIGKCHLNKRFRSTDLQLSSFEIKRINEDRPGVSENLYIELTFINSKNDFCAKIPLFLNGMIILSNNEDKPH